MCEKFWFCGTIFSYKSNFKFKMLCCEMYLVSLLLIQCLFLMTVWPPRIWGVKCGGVGSPYQSWREMFIHRPRLCFEGCYISKTTYIRHGENSFQDQFYKPWHLVEYFRYLRFVPGETALGWGSRSWCLLILFIIRFFPDGRVLSLTTAEEPVSSVGLLKGRTPPPRHPPVFVGYYRLVDRTVSIVLMPGPDKYKNRCNSNQSPTFHMVMIYWLLDF